MTERRIKKKCRIHTRQRNKRNSTPSVQESASKQKGHSHARYECVLFHLPTPPSDSIPADKSRQWTYQCHDDAVTYGNVFSYFVYLQFLYKIKIPERYKDAFGYQVDFVINQLSYFLTAISAKRFAWGNRCSALRTEARLVGHRCSTRNFSSMDGLRLDRLRLHR